MILNAIGKAQSGGARLSPACKIAEISARTIERWRRAPHADDRRCGPHHRPANALSQTEETQLITLMMSTRFAHLSPKQLVPQLADRGVYLASESTFYRLQRRYGLRSTRRTIARTEITRATRLHRAVGPNQVWSWDITWLATTVRGTYLHLYLVLDVWSRRIVGWCIAERGSAEIAAELITHTCREGNFDPRGLVLHSDNGKPMRASTFISTLQWLGVIPSFSRPHVSDDNPYSEALFRTLKHTPAYPRLPFDSLAGAQRWMTRFAAWYNGEHRHSAIRYVTPDERHYGREKEILARRQRLYERARQSNPERWTGATRDWTPVQTVTLNPTGVSEPPNT